MTDSNDSGSLTAEIINRLSHIKDAIVKEMALPTELSKDQKELLKLAKKSGAATLAALESGIKKDMETAAHATRQAVGTALVHIANEAGVKLSLAPTGGRKASGTGSRSRMTEEELAEYLKAVETAAKKIPTEGWTRAELVEKVGVDDGKMQTVIKKAVAKKIIKTNGKVGKAGRYLAV